MRVLVKFSGEALKTRDGIRAFDREALVHIAKEVRNVLLQFPDIELVLMPGGGNQGRGAELQSELGLSGLTAHQIGMLYTMVNAIAFRDVLAPMVKDLNFGVRVMTALEANAVAEPYLPQRAIHHLENNRVVICAGGSGRTHFSTDLAGANRASELRCEAMLKGTKEDGVFDSDPRENSNAQLIHRMTPREFLERDLRKIFDPEGVAYARENKLSIRVFNIFGEGNLLRAISGEDVGTLIAEE